MRLEKRALKTVGFEVVVLDEAHRVKKGVSITRDALAAIPYHWMLMLTGAAPVGAAAG